MVPKSQSYIPSPDPDQRGGVCRRRPTKPAKEYHKLKNNREYSRFMRLSAGTSGRGEYGGVLQLRPSSILRRYDRAEPPISCLQDRALEHLLRIMQHLQAYVQEKRSLDDGSGSDSGEVFAIEVAYKSHMWTHAYRRCRRMVSAHKLAFPLCFRLSGFSVLDNWSRTHKGGAKILPALAWLRWVSRLRLCAGCQQTRHQAP